MYNSALGIIFLVGLWYGGEGNAIEEPIQKLLHRGESGDQGSCPNHFAEFFYQISQRNRGTKFLADTTDIEQQAWLSTSFQLFELSELLKGLNGTEGNKSQPDPTPSPKFKCREMSIENGSGEVIMVNSSELVRLVSQRPNASAIANSSVEASTNSSNSSQSSENVCVVVMFFATSCRFSAATAPHYNAFGRAMSAVNVLAFDINQSNGVNSRYGIVAVPSIVLFHNGKLAARFNESQRSLESMMDFVHNLTGLPVNKSVTVLEEDHEGPVPTTAVIGPDYFLWFSNTFLLLCGLRLLQHKVGAAVRAKITAIQDYIVQVWRTGEFYEQVGIADNDEVPMDNDNAEIR